MCTAITYKTKDSYFGRNLDYEFSYSENITITPRNYTFNFRCEKPVKEHYAMIGMAYVYEGYPLYYDATNEVGLSMAGLLFPDNACYKGLAQGKCNISPFEFIPWVLATCENVEQAEELILKTNLVNIEFNKELPLSPLHWLVADEENSFVVEAVKEGVKIYKNPLGVLTNNPPFDMQMFNLSNYMFLSSKRAENRFSDKIDLKEYSRGMGAMGMPGDLSSQSRFVRAAFTKLNSVSGESEEESISQFFHILSSVEQQRGCVELGDDKYEITIYSSCCNMNKGIYYYKTYNNSQITAVDMRKENLEQKNLISYPLIDKEQIKIQNFK